eukprot:gene2880-5646_t
MSHRVEPSHLAALQHKTENIRNICILAHIDHGKTTLSDSLVCSNGIISPKLSGKLRFLDSTEEEQKRGITMHSSAISLLYRMEDRKATKDTSGAPAAETQTDTTPPVTEDFLINLVDSPGHIDFSSDVSTATRLCDGALIVIDVLEGLCTQTHAVLYKALKERMRPCLVLNKIDRLILELQLTPVEAFHHLRRVLENANALASSLLGSELIQLRGDDTDTDTALSVEYKEEEERLMSAWNFAPERGNVMFAAALDSWGFGTGRFATFWAQKLGVNRGILLKYLFEDYSFNAKTKKVVKCDPDNGASVPMFASMVLEPIWQIYQTCVTQQEPAKAARMAQRGMGVELPAREINTRDTKMTLQAIMRRWLPLPDAILRMVVRCIPCPVVAQQERLSTLFREDKHALSGSSSRKQTVSSQVLCDRAGSVKDLVRQCRSDNDADVVVYIAKMTEVRVAELSPRDVTMLTQKLCPVLPDDETAPSNGETAGALGDVVFMALARVYSGILKRDSRIFVLSHRHDPLGCTDDENPDPDGLPPASITTAKLVPLNSIGMYLCFGPSVFPVEEAPAGNIVGIVGLNDMVLKTGTVSSTWCTHPMAAITFQAKPLVRVAVEPLHYQDLPRLEAGLQSLYQYDPVVEVGVDDTGQHTMTCLGELHLEQCLKTLTERFARCEVKASAPLVPFRETVVVMPAAAGSGVQRPVLPPPWKDTPGLTTSLQGRVRMVSGTQSVAITHRCCALPLDTAAILEDAVSGPLATLCSLIDKEKKMSGGDIQTDDIPDSAQTLWKRIIASIESSVADGVSDPAWTTLGSDDTATAEKEKLLQESSLFKRIITFGPKGCGCNVMMFSNDISIDIQQQPILSGETTTNGETEGKGTRGTILGTMKRGSPLYVSETLTLSFEAIWLRLHSAVLAGFQATSSSGPLMQEPLHGMCFVLEHIEVTAAFAGLGTEDINALCAATAVKDDVSTCSQVSTELVQSPLSSNGGGGGAAMMSGQILSEMKDSFRLGMLSCPLRIVEPVYACNLQCDQAHLGSLYAVLSRRRGVVTKEDIIEGTSLFLLSATLPVSESFGFAQELLKKTSGSATAPQLVFSHWAVHEDDPFWKPTTAEELEDHGDQAGEPNQARLFIDTVRRRKGLPVEEKIVVHAEKQRTLTKMK